MNVDGSKIGKVLSGTGSVLVDSGLPLTIGNALSDYAARAISDQVAGQSPWMQYLAMGFSDAIKQSFVTSLLFPEKVPK